MYSKLFVFRDQVKKKLQKTNYKITWEKKHYCMSGYFSSHFIKHI